MRGLHLSLFAWAIILLVMILAILYIGYGLASPDWWNQLFANETKNILLTIEEDYETGLPTGSIITASKKLGYSHYSVSELSCDIAKDIYNDFISWGEKRPSLDYYFKGQSCFIQPMGGYLCEYNPDLKDYVCLVGFGRFNLSQTTLTQDDKKRLNNSGCCDISQPLDFCGCTWDAGSEYKLDEICINEFFNNLKYHGDPFCTSNPTYTLHTSGQRLKFGNRGCYWNTNNVDPSEETYVWQDHCDDFCNANSVGPLTEKDYDRIYIWRADNVSSASNLNDLGNADIFLNSSAQNVIDDGRLYFYSIYWNDTNKRYEIQFPRLVSPEFPGVQRSFDRVGLLSFIPSFFDNENDARRVTAGYLWPELRTVYDGLIDLTEDVSKTDILNRLLSLNVEVTLKDCLERSKCLNYDFNSTIWQEELDQYSAGNYILKDSNWLIKNENPIYIRTDIAEEKIPAGRYRIMIRNWRSEYCYEKSDKQECGAIGQTWCMRDDIRTAGKKIWCENKPSCPLATDVVQPGDCVRTSSYVGTQQTCSKFNVQRWADKSLIIIKIPSCSDTDVDASHPDGINPEKPGAVTFDGQTYPDKCVNSTNLYERFCRVMDIGTKNQYCTFGCNVDHCIVCNNNIKEGSEQCDGSDLGTPPKTCTDLGYTGGTLTCKGDCTGFDTSSCASGGGGGGGGGCLIEGTNILTPDGFKKIEDVQVGDIVIGYKDKKITETKVTKKTSHFGFWNIYNYKEQWFTENHKVYPSWNEEAVVITLLSNIKKQYTGIVYNIETTTHNYFGENDLLIHNAMKL